MGFKARPAAGGLKARRLGLAAKKAGRVDPAGLFYKGAAVTAAAAGAALAAPAPIRCRRKYMAAYEVILMDADETIFDFARAEAFALEKAFAQCGLAMAETTLADYDAINKDLWRRFERGEIAQADLKVERFRLLFLQMALDCDARTFGDIYLDRLAQCDFLIDGAQELCAYLSGKYRLAIITNGIQRVQRSRFERSPIRRFFEDIVISEEAGSSKPSAGIFTYAFERLGISDKRKVLIVGDSLHSDIAGGFNFGIDTCWVNISGQVNKSAVIPTYEARRLADLKKLL